LLAIFGLAFLIAVIPLLVTAVRYRQELRKAAVGELDDTAVLSLQPEKTSIAEDESVTVEVKLDTGGQDAYGADVIIVFDPDVLELTDIGWEMVVETTNFKTLAPIIDEEGMFDEERVINCANHGGSEANCTAGVIEFGDVTFDFSQIEDPDYDPCEYPVNGPDVLVATLEFKGKAEGISSLEFDFDPANPDETADCNIVAVDCGQRIVDDILKEVVNTEITVGQCQWRSCGDSNCDNSVDLAIDFITYRYELKGDDVPDRDADFNGQDGVTVADFVNFRYGYRCEGDCSGGPWCD
jgi:hypothetical protein